MIAVALALFAADPLLQPLQFLVGHCWLTRLKEGPTDTHCFEAIDAGSRIRDRHSVRKDDAVIYTGESIFSVKNGRLHYRYTGSTGALLEGPMHAAGDKIVFDDTDNTGSETFWRRVDERHYEDVTHAPAALKHFESRKLFELLPDRPATNRPARPQPAAAPSAFRAAAPIPSATARHRASDPS